MMNRTEDTKGTDANRDPITKAPGAHPLGTGVGAIGGGVVGGAIGAPAGPIGAAIGAAAGAVAGGLVGKAVGEELDPTVEEAYWEESYATRPYYQSGLAYSDYAPAYRYGWEAAGNNRGRSFDDVQGSLESGWEKVKSSSKLSWEKAKDATRDAYDRVTKKKFDR